MNGWSLTLRYCTFIFFASTHLQMVLLEIPRSRDASKSEYRLVALTIGCSVVIDLFFFLIVIPKFKHEEGECESCPKYKGGYVVIEVSARVYAKNKTSYAECH